METSSEREWFIMNKFVDIKGFEGLYKINQQGQILTFHKTVKFLNPMLDKKGYLRVELRKNSKRKGYFVHRLVAETFIPPINNKPFVNHIDGNKQNNCVENLEWCSNLENQRHAWKTGLAKPRYNEKHPRCHIDKKTVLEIRHLRNDLKISVKEISEKFNIGRSTVSDIALFKRRLAV